MEAVTRSIMIRTDRWLKSHWLMTGLDSSPSCALRFCYIRLSCFADETAAAGVSRCVCFSAAGLQEPCSWDCELSHLVPSQRLSSEGDALQVASSSSVQPPDCDVGSSAS